MTDYSDLVQRLRGPIKHPQQLINASNEAANTIEYLAAEEDHLWTKINKMTVVIKLMDARIEELEETLKPFADMTQTQNFKDYENKQDDCVMTAGVWGFKPDFTFKLGDLRQSRKALEDK